MSLMGDSGRLRVYIVLFDEPNSRAAELLRTTYKSHYKLNEKTYLVRSTLLTDQIAKSVGIKGEGSFRKRSRLQA